MTLDDQRIALLKFIGYESKDLRGTGERIFKRKGMSPGVKGSDLPYFYDNYNDIREVEELAGLHLRTNLELRVKWVNTLRDIVGRSCPKNKSGTALVSDVDLLMASPTQRVEALLKILKLWKVSST
jgi:hypothetical protein